MKQLTDFYGRTITVKQCTILRQHANRMLDIAITDLADNGSTLDFKRWHIKYLYYKNLEELVRKNK